MTEEGAKRFTKKRKDFQNAIFAYATLLAQKDGMDLINEVHIEKASRRVNYVQNTAIKWVLTISMVVLVGLAFFQMAVIYASFQLSLRLLPIFSIVWTIVVAYVLRDFL